MAFTLAGSTLRPRFPVKHSKKESLSHQKCFLSRYHTISLCACTRAQLVNGQCDYSHLTDADRHEYGQICHQSTSVHNLYEGAEQLR